MASALGGILAGAGLGWVGSLVSYEARIIFATLLGLLAIFIGIAELSGKRLFLPQFDRETPRTWVDEGAFQWAFKNGFFLGIGATSRIGFWLWFVVPFAALLSASAWMGAVVYGIYSAVRALMIWPALLGLNRDDASTWVVTYKKRASDISNLFLLLTGMVVVVVVGF